MIRSLTLLIMLALASCSTTTSIEKSTPTISGGEVIDGDNWRESRGDVLRTFAWRALEKGLSEEATGYLQEACELDPEDASSHAALARIMLAGGQSRKALVFAERAVMVAPEQLECQLVWAASLSENQRDEEANAVLEMAWENGMQSPEVARALITYYSANNQQSQANDFVQTMLADNPEDAQAWAAAGDLYLAEGQLEAAATAYTEALERDPAIPAPSVLESRLGTAMRDVDPVLSAAMLAEQNNDLVGAERLYRFLVNNERADSHVIAGLARVLWANKKSDQAQTVLNKIQVDQRNWREHLLQAKLDIGRKRWSAAKGALLIALQERPGLRAAELLLGLCNRNITGVVVNEH